MKIKFSAHLILISVFFFISCSSNKLSKEMEQFIRPERGTLFRGLELGKSKDEAILLEQSLTILDENSEKLIYNLSLTPTESAQLSYEFNIMNSIIKIQADLLIGNIEKQDQYFNEIFQHFHSLSGEPDKKTPQKIIWNNYEKEYQIVLQKQAMKTIYDIQLLIIPIINTPPGMAFITEPEV